MPAVKKSTIADIISIDKVCAALVQTSYNQVQRHNLQIIAINMLININKQVNQ